MPTPEEVNPRNFLVDQIVFNDRDFSIAWGRWEDGSMHLAMRWNGEGPNPGYPKTFGNPVWFLLPDHLTIPVLRGILGLEYSNLEAITNVIRNLTLIH